jgi:hypothetical protein
LSHPFVLDGLNELSNPILHKLLHIPTELCQQPLPHRLLLLKQHPANRRLLLWLHHSHPTCLLLPQQAHLLGRQLLKPILKLQQPLLQLLIPRLQVLHNSLVLLALLLDVGATGELSLQRLYSLSLELQLVAVHVRRQVGKRALGFEGLQELLVRVVVFGAFQRG